MLNTDRLCPGCMNDNGGESPCSICGWSSQDQNGKNQLPVRYVLATRYIIGRALSSNAVSTTYIAWDNATDTQIYVTEYFPLGVAVRNPDYTISMLDDNKFTFNEGLMQFLELGKFLQGSELASITPVSDIFEENGSAYSVSPIITGITLEDFLERNGGNLKWEQVRPLFLPLIDTLITLHKSGLLHGGISPETLMVGRDGKLRFAPLQISRLYSAALTQEPHLTDGYSAAEQYHDAPVDEAADVYALSSVLFRVLIGTVPPCAKEREELDTLTIPAHFAEELPRPILVSLANGLQISKEKRTTSIEGFKNELVYGETAEVTRPKVSTPKTNAAKKSNKKEMSTAKYALVSALVTAVVFLVIAGAVLLLFKDRFFKPADAPYNTSSDYVTDTSRPQIGDYDSEVVNSVKLYKVPELTGKYFSEIEDIEGYDKFKIMVEGKTYSDKYPRGQICVQSVEAGKEVERETEIKLTISLGPQEFKIASVIGLTEQEAKLELLKQGFLYENIKVGEAYDDTKKGGVVLEQTPEFNTKTTAEAQVTIYINTFKEE